ncbi:MAG: response regulator [Candidatus Omnitrophica bacterium]|nr:response regulator [Candidatus Omnitrophota bacterium]
MKIANKISLYFFFTAFVLATVSLAFICVIVTGSLKDEVKKHLKDTVAAKDQTVKSYLDMLRLSVIQSAENEILKGFLLKYKNDPQSSQEMFITAQKDLLKYRNAITNLNDYYISDTTGKIILSTDENMLNKDISADSSFLAAREGTFIKHPYAHEGIREAMIAISAPIKNSTDGELLGVIIAEIKMDYLNTILKNEYGFGKTGETYLVNKYGYMISNSRFIKGAFLKQKVNTANFRQCLADLDKDHETTFKNSHDKHEGLIIAEDYRGVMTLGTHVWNTQMKWCLLAEIDTSEAFAPLRKIQLILLLILLVIPFAALAVGIFLGKIITNQLQKLKRGIEVISSGMLFNQIKVDSNDEIGQISRAFNKMANDLKDSVTSINNLNAEIASRQLAEKSLKKISREWEETFNSIQDMISIQDKECRLLRVNKAYADAFNLTPKEVIGKKCHVLVHGLENPHSACPHVRTLENKSHNTSEIFEPRLNAFLEVNVSPIFDDKGEVIGTVHIAKNITQRKKDEELLKESSMRIRSITDSAQDAIIMMDNKGLVSFWNPAGEKILGYKPDEIIGKPLHEILSPSRFHEAHKAAFPQWQNSGKGFAIGKTLELSAIKKDGTEIPVDLSLSSVFLSGEWQAVGILRDISERKKSENLLKKANDDLLKSLETAETLRDKYEEASKKSEKLAKAKTEFLANMSHEIRTPMNAIIGFTDLLTRTSIDEKQRHYLQSIRSGGELLLAIIEDILNFSKIESEKIKLENINFDLRYLIKDVFHLILPKMSEQLLDSYIDIPRELNCLLKGDPTRLRQIFVNLLTNAAKFTKAGSVGIIVREESRNTENGEITLKLSVKDTGIGIPEDKTKTIFDAFEQADTSTTRKFGGTGLGLAIVRSLVKIMGGSVWAESVLGQGSEFFIRLTFKQADESFNNDILPLSIKELKGKKAVIVDDNLKSLELVNTYCQNAGIEVVKSATSVEDAISFINAIKDEPFKIDLVLTDIMMPDNDGYELARQIRKLGQFNSLKIIALTSDLRIGSAEDAKSSGFNGYLPKPIIENELIKLIATVLGDKRTDEGIITRHLANELTCTGKKVLVVDDSITNQELMKAYLDTLECIGDYATNGREAVEKVKTGTYDICFMDIQMPEMDGIEATIFIRNNINKTLPIIALTAEIVRMDEQKCFDSGMNDLLAKPIQLRQLRDSIRKHCP